MRIFLLKASARNITREEAMKVGTNKAEFDDSDYFDMDLYAITGSSCRYTGGLSQ